MHQGGGSGRKSPLWLLLFFAPLANLLPFAEFQNKDDAYCFSLAKALYCVATPVTVGFFAPWGHCKTFLLKRIQGERF